MNRNSAGDRETATLREAVRRAYSKAAEEPEAGHPFPVGREFALALGYPKELLDRLPEEAVEAFAGVSYLGGFAELDGCRLVLDLGCGSGVDSLMAAREAGSEGIVVGIDFSASMLSRAESARRKIGVTNVFFVEGAAEELPFRRASFDAVLVNGIFNLNPHRRAIFRELARVVRPGGKVYTAELVLREPLPEEITRDPANWFA